MRLASVHVISSVIAVTVRTRASMNFVGMQQDAFDVTEIDPAIADAFRFERPGVLYGVREDLPTCAQSSSRHMCTQEDHDHACTP